MDTVAQRWARLEPHTHVFGPEDDRPRPAVILFHGCGGLRPHLPLYADAAVKAGWRAFVVDSYAARGWDRSFGIAFVCTGMRFQGYKRAGDVLGATWGVSQRPDVDADSVVLAGWSHGSWSIMDLMTMGLLEPGEAGLADPSPTVLDGVKGLFLAYPYGGPPALSRTRPWVRAPRTLGVISRHDHITPAGTAARLYEKCRAVGADVEVWTVDGTHAFDEPTGVPPMRHDPLLAAESVRRFRAFLEATPGAAREAAA